MNGPLLTCGSVIKGFCKLITEDGHTLMHIHRNKPKIDLIHSKQVPLYLSGWSWIENCLSKWQSSSYVDNAFRLFVVQTPTQPTSEQRSTKSRINSSPRLTSSSWWGTCRCQWWRRISTRCLTLLTRTKMGRSITGKEEGRGFLHYTESNSTVHFYPFLCLIFRVYKQLLQVIVR